MEAVAEIDDSWYSLCDSIFVKLIRREKVQRMIDGFLLMCSVIAVVYLFNVVAVIVNICIKKRSMQSIIRINPYKFFKKIFWNMNNGFGTDRKAGIVPIICTIMTVIGLCSMIAKIFHWI